MRVLQFYVYPFRDDEGRAECWYVGVVIVEHFWLEWSWQRHPVYVHAEGLS